MNRMALKGIRVVEIAGLAPAPYCGMILSDFGAKVIRVDKVKTPFSIDRCARGKQSIAVNLKDKAGCELVHKIANKADVLIEPFRSGVMERLGLGPEILCKENPKLIYARLTGYGQKGPYSAKAGHDINYIATSGVLSALGRSHEKPYAPINLVADFAGGGMTCAMGILAALYERSLSGMGQVIDASMTEGSAYVASWLWTSQDLFVWGNDRGNNPLDGGAHFYDTYKTSDGKYMAVGALEPQFYAELLKGLEITEKEAPHMSDFEESRKKFEQIFLKRTQAEWTEIFDKLDACVTPVIDMKSADTHPHNVINKTFTRNSEGGLEPQPAPRLSRTPGKAAPSSPGVGEHTRDILLDLDFSQNQIDDLQQQGIIECSDVKSKL